jgi:AcrR family transcriptional regulator
MYSAAPAPSAGVRAAASATRRAAILRAALKLFVTKGYTATTMDDLRQLSGASTGSIYHHFGTKAVVASALYVEGLRDYQDGYVRELERHEDAEAAIKAVVAHHLQWIMANRELANFLFHHREPELELASRRPLRVANSRFFGAVAAWLDAQATRGVIRRLPRDLYYSLWIAPAQEFGRAWLLGRTTTPIEKAAVVLGGAAWQALRATPEEGDGR